MKPTDVFVLRTTCKGDYFYLSSVSQDGLCAMFEPVLHATKFSREEMAKFKEANKHITGRWVLLKSVETV